ncbi:MAG: oxidoreductase [Bacillota bacterium]
MVRKTLVRKGVFYDSVTLMRVSEAVQRLPGVRYAAVLMGTELNRALLADRGFAVEAGEEDLVIALEADSAAQVEDAAKTVELLLEKRSKKGIDEAPRSVRAAMHMLGGADLCIVSVPGRYAVREANEALRLGMDVFLFSDNVSIEDEISLKREAAAKGLLVMGPDCGTAYIGGRGIGFANVVRAGPIGVVSAAGTGLQEAACLLDRAGFGISMGIGVGGRDLSREVGGLMTLAAIDRLAQDTATRAILVISKPPWPEVAARVMKKLEATSVPYACVFLGQTSTDGRAVPTIDEGCARLGELLGIGLEAPAAPEPRRAPGFVFGAYAGGTLCSQAAYIFQLLGRAPATNLSAPWQDQELCSYRGDVLLDLGADEYTRGRPHPMIDPATRADLLRRALLNPSFSVLVFDVVLGLGSHPDPAGELVRAIGAAGQDLASRVLVASVTGTDRDPQVRSAQEATLRAAGVTVCPTAASAARFAAEAAGRERK